MAAPKTVVWPLEPHTAAKHAILSRYLNAWVPILGSGGFQHVVYLDAFAGPGSYSGGEDGSPILAIKALLEQRTSFAATMHFHFVEAREDRASHLRRKVEELLGPSGQRARWVVHHESFETAYPKIKHSLPQSQRVPMFAFIDPFGWAGLPMSIARDILSRPSCEVLINFMYEEINRFLNHPDQGHNFDELFGGHDWVGIVHDGGQGRNDRLRQLYGAQLQSFAKARLVRSFEMRNKGDATDYFLFFATNSTLGLKKMKEAMWKVDEGGGFSFSDATDQSQLVLFSKEPDLDALAAEMRRHFGQKTVSVDEVESFVVEHTAFRETHFKSILKSLESQSPSGLTVTRAKAGRRRGTFPAGTCVRFS